MKNSFGIKERDTWLGTCKQDSKSFICWNCSNPLAAQEGFVTRYGDPSIYICHHCNAPNVFDYLKKPIMQPLFGRTILNLPTEVETTYNEARGCFSIGAYTASVMMCRKLLMNIAVENNAEEGKNFSYYVDFLNSAGVIPIKSQHLANKIRTLGNLANHKIEQRTEEEANNLLTYIQLLLQCNYEIAENISIT